MIVTIKELGPWVVSLIALIQVWVIALWKRYRKGKIEIYETGNIEIGYSNFGPTIGLIGTLNCLHREVFIKRISLIVVRKKDNATHNFSWTAFRDNQFTLSGNEPRKLEIASSFLLTLSAPHKYNIVFTENAFIAESKHLVGSLQMKWSEFLSNQLKELEKNPDFNIESMAKQPLLAQSLFNEFSKLKEVTDVFSTLNNVFYWMEGEYELTLNVEPANSKRTFKKTWNFTLSSEDSDGLRLNVVPMLRTICGFNEVFNFSYPEYQDNKLTDISKSNRSLTSR